MPPEEETQPTEKEIEQVVNWLGVKLKEGESPDGGQTKGSSLPAESR